MQYLFPLFLLSVFSQFSAAQIFHPQPLEIISEQEPQAIEAISLHNGNQIFSTYFRFQDGFVTSIRDRETGNLIRRIARTNHIPIARKDGDFSLISTNGNTVLFLLGNRLSWFNTNTGEMIGERESLKSSFIFQEALTGDGTQAIVSLRQTGEKKVGILNLNNNELIESAAFPEFPRGASFIPNRNQAYVYYDNTVFQISTANGNITQSFELTDESDPISALIITGDQENMITAHGRSVVVRDGNTATPILKFENEEFPVGWLKLSPSEQFLLTGRSNRNSQGINLWSIETGDQVFRITTHPTIPQSLITAVGFTNNDEVLLVGDRVGNISLLNLDTFQSTIEQDYEYTSGTFSPDGKSIVLGRDNGIVSIVDIETEQVKFESKLHYGPVTGVKFFSDGNRIVSGSIDGRTIITDLISNATQTLYLPDEPDAVSSLDISPDENFIVTAGGVVRGEAKLWSANTGGLVRTFLGHENWVSDVVFFPDGNSILTASYDGSAIQWDIYTGDVINRFGDVDQNHFNDSTHWLNKVTVSNDGSRVLTGSFWGKVITWDAQMQVPISSLVDPEIEFPAAGTFAHNGILQSISLSPDNRFITTTDLEFVKLWNANTGELLRVFDGIDEFPDQDEIREAAFSPDGSLLLTVGDVIFIREVQPFASINNWQLY